jgi:hypothetical protein
MPAKTMFDIFASSSEAMYRAQAAQAAASFRKKIALAAGPAPTVVLERDNVLRLKCSCGNWPAVDPNWALACCFQCGLVYEGLTILPEWVA